MTVSVLHGWSCTLLHDHPEDEGIVWWDSIPEPGMHFKLPSSHFVETWEVQSVNHENMSFTAIRPQ